MWRIRLAIMILCGAQCVYCAVPLTVENRYFRTEFIAPDEPREVPVSDARFFRAGWIQGLFLVGSDQNLFRTTSIVDYHPVAGFAAEFLPALPTGAAQDGDYVETLKIGVGVIREHCRNPFRAYPVRLYNWRSTFVREADGTAVITSRQVAPEYASIAYDLTVRVTVAANEPVIVIGHCLKNTGKVPICGTLYLHPFFNVASGLEHAWAKLPDSAASFVKNTPGRIEKNPRGRVVSAGGFGGVGVFRIESARMLEQAEYWSNEEDCFAVEPFISVNLPPGEQLDQTWRITIKP